MNIQHTFIPLSCILGVVKPTIPERHSDLLANAAIGTTPQTNSFAMQEKKEPSAKKKVTARKNATTKKEDFIKKEDSTQEEDPAKKEAAAKPHFSEKKINEIVQRLREKVAEHRRLQEEGILPYRKPAPITVMEIPYVMLVINRKRGIASKLMKEIRAELGKKPRQRVSVTEFCKHTGIPIEDVRDALYNLT